LERIRSCCEFTGYLRLILDGHLKAGDLEEEKDIWEETVRLRERMFWSRIAGGLVPLVTQATRCAVETKATNSSEDYAEENLKNEITHPTNNDGIEYKGHDIKDSSGSTGSQRDSSVFAPSLPDFDMATSSSTSDVHKVEQRRPEDSASDFSLGRASIDSDMSVYEEAEEANTNVDTVYADSEDIQTPTVQEAERKEVPLNPLGGSLDPTHQ